MQGKKQKEKSERDYNVLLQQKAASAERIFVFAFCIWTAQTKVKIL